MKKIFYIILITQITIGFAYSQSGWVRQNLSPNLELDGVYFTNENTGYIGGTWWDTTIILKTSNAGLNWYSIYSNGILGYVSLFFLNDNTGFATCPGIFKTTNSGINWIEKYHSPVILSCLVFTSPDTGYACGKYNTMIKSTNGGENWFTQVNIGGHHNNMHFINNNTGFTVSEGDFVMKTTNGGINWIRKNVGYNSRLYAVNFTDSNTGFCAGWNGQNMQLFKSINGSESWIQITGLAGGMICRIYFINSLTGFAVGSSILKTTNAGETWQLKESYNDLVLYSVDFVNSNTGYAVGIDINDNGILLKTTTGGEPIGIQPISGEVPNQFILLQNYPNPFNPSTKILFSIPPLKGARGMISKLVIYDILGREAAVLVNEQLSPGVYEVEWNGYNYASGVYFYQLSINNEKFAAKKMVLLK